MSPLEWHALSPRRAWNTVQCQSMPFVDSGRATRLPFDALPLAASNCYAPTKRSHVAEILP